MWLHFGREFIVCRLHSVVPCCHWKFFVYSEWHSTYSKQRDVTRCQVVAYKRLKQWKIVKLSGLKVVAITYERWSFTRDSNNYYYMSLTSEIKLRVTSRFTRGLHFQISKIENVCSHLQRWPLARHSDYYDFTEKEIDIYSVKLGKV